MNISFIVTSYNIAPYIEQCLQSVAASARAGDEIIIVDDGSTDDTEKLIRRFANGDLPVDLHVIPVLLGKNTYGGVGIAANIGMDHACRETVFFVDGDDWLDSEGVNHARDVFQARNIDFLLTNYSVYNQATDSYSSPADSHRWPEIKPGLTGPERLELVLSFIAVPWRKFYRRSFLREHKLRFPEGDFFYEDNPFHWQVCRAAASFGFLNQTVCYHRINRSGQTMAATGAELLAFFTHYETIVAHLPPQDSRLQAAAMTWLVNNMSWHLERLHPSARRPWAQKAMTYLQAFDTQLWQQTVAPPFADWPVGEACEQLRAGDIQGFLTTQKIEDLGRQIAQVQSDIEELRHDHHTTRTLAQASANAQEYAALLAIFKAR